MASWEDVRRIALALPDVEESTSYGHPCFKVRGRSFVNASREDGAVYVPCPHEEVDLLLRAKPDVYFQTPHYEGWGVLLRLAAADENELAGALEDAYEREGAKKPLKPRRAAKRRPSA
jgi:hypothetical protein